MAIRTAIDSVGDSALDQFRAARRLATLGMRPRTTLRVAETMRRAALRTAEDAISPAPGSYLNRPIGPQRALVTTRMAMQRLERLKRGLDVKLNDVVLAIAAGALRRFATRDGGEAGQLRVMVPVNVRGGGEAGAAGNRITFGFVDLPVGEPDPLRRVATIQAQTSDLKESGRISGSDALLGALERMPGFVQERAARLAASPRMYNLTVSNVPGPRLPLYATGSRVRTIYPAIPLSDGHAMSIGVLTYCGGVHFAAYADPEALPGVHELRTLLPAAARELERALDGGYSAASSRSRSATRAAARQTASSRPAV